MKRLIQFALPKSRIYVTSLFVSVVQGLSAVALLATSAWLISRAAQQPPIMYLSIAIVGVRTFALARASLRYAERWLSHDAVLRSSGQRRSVIFEKLIDFVPAGLGNQSLADLSSSTVSDVDETQNFGLRILSPLVQSLLVSLISTVVFWFMLPNAALVMAVLLLGAYVVALPAAALISRKIDVQTANHKAKLATETARLLDNFELLENYEWTESALSRIELMQQKLAAGSRLQALSLGASQAVFAFGAGLSALAAGAIAIESLSANHGDFVMLAVFALLPLAVFDVASAAQPIVSAWRRYRGSAERLIELAERDLPAELRFNGVEALSDLHSLSIESATLGYSGNHDVVEHFSLEIEEGQSLALMGASGAGKSTIALAMAGFLQPRSGRILLNGRNSGDFSSESIRQQIGYLEQNAMVFATDVRTNLKIANQNANDDELVGVLSRLGLWDAFKNRAGLDTQLGELGVLISGGEAQRLALARAILAGFKLIILDEPTANLDEIQGKKLVQDILSVAKSNNRMVVLITHDAKLAKLADRIINV